MVDHGKAGSHAADIIVVGAGSAGSAVATRLAEASHVNVLLIEAGQDYPGHETPEIIRDGAFIVSFHKGRPYYWPGVVAQRTAVQQPTRYRLGRGVGGGSAVNAQFAIRPPIEDFRRWQCHGGSAWAPERILREFINLENDLDFGDRPYHGTSGPVPVWRAPLTDWSRLDHALAEASVSAGHPWTPDHNAPGARGVSPFACNSPDFRRVTSNDAYLDRARPMPNFRIVSQALVDHVLVEQGRVKGVRVIAGGEVQDFLASEVVLCAGAVYSPAILQRSGFGDPSRLRKLGIPVVANLPAVGSRVREHVSLLLKLRLSSPAPPAKRQSNCVVRWSSGRFSASPDLQLISTNVVGDLPSDKVGLRLTLNSCESEGSVTINSADPSRRPRIRLNLLSTSADIDAMTDGYRHVLDLLGKRSMAELCAGAAVDKYGAPPPSAAAPGEVLRQWMLSVADDSAHIAGTCRLGDEMSGVVAGDFRVHGVKGLRVADISVAPTIPLANTNLTAVMIGEMAAKCILNAY